MAELLVLRADAPRRARLAAGFEIGDQVAAGERLALPGGAFVHAPSQRSRRSCAGFPLFGRRCPAYRTGEPGHGRAVFGAARPHRQSPARACQQASAAATAVSARRIRGPSRACTAAGCPASRRRSAGAKPPSGPPECQAGAVGQRLGDRAFGLGVADQQPALRRPAGERIGERAGGRDGRHLQAAALLRRLDGVGAESLDIDPPGLAVAGEDRVDGADAELGRLLDREAGALGLERREQEPQVGRRRLRPRASRPGGRRRGRARGSRWRPPTPRRGR